MQRNMPGYEKTKRYFIRTNLYKYLTENGDLERAMSNSEKLRQDFGKTTPHYCQLQWNAVIYYFLFPLVQDV